MKIEEKIKNLLNNKGTLTYRGILSSGDMNNHWYETYNIKFIDNSSEQCNKYWIKIFKEVFKNNTIEIWIHNNSAVLNVKNSVKLQRKEKLQTLNSL